MPSGGSGGIGGFGYQRSLLASPDPDIVGFDGGEAAAGGGMSGLQEFGSVLAISGVLQSAIGSYYSAQAQKYELKSQASDLEFRQSMAARNARIAESDAQLELEAGKRESGRVSLHYRQVKQAAAASAAARGVQAGVGSAAEIQTSIEFAKEMDRNTIDANATRRANAHRARAVDLQNMGRVAGVSAETARRGAGLASPGYAAGTSLLAGAGGVSRQWALWNRRSWRHGGE